MAKKTTGKPMDVPKKEGNPIPHISKALQRVKDNGSYEGIFLSSAQLKTLITALKTERADGAFFMIGKEATKHSVEVIPFKLDLDIQPQFYVKEGVKGSVDMNLGKPFGDNNQWDKLIIDNDGLRPDVPSHLDDRKGSSQKTPPPRSA
jgi:hypothetical protein